MNWADHHSMRKNIKWNLLWEDVLNMEKNITKEFLERFESDIHKTSIFDDLKENEVRLSLYRSFWRLWNAFGGLCTKHILFMDKRWLEIILSGKWLISGSRCAYSKIYTSSILAYSQGIPSEINKYPAIAEKNKF